MASLSKEQNRLEPGVAYETSLRPCESQCPMCESKATAEVFLYNGNIPMRKCNHCLGEYCGRRFSSDELEAFYGGAYFQGEYGYKDYQSLADMKRKTFAARLTRLEKQFALRGGHSGRHLLDVGCADGLLVRTACARGWAGWGLDISLSAIKSARDSAASEVDRARLIDGVLEKVDLRPGSFDAIVMSDMIEHVHNPVSVLQRARELLADDGVLLIETPQAQGLMHKLMGRRWPMYRPPEHLLYFSTEGLRSALSRAGFALIEGEPTSKAFTLRYLRDKLRVSNPIIARTISPLAWILGGTCFWVPSGSFMVVARKVVE